MLDMDDFTSVEVKADPEDVIKLREKYRSVVKPINLSEKYWIELDFGGDLPDSKVYELAKNSYEIVKAKYSKRKRQ